MRLVGEANDAQPRPGRKPRRHYPSLASGCSRIFWTVAQPRPGRKPRRHYHRRLAFVLAMFQASERSTKAGA